MPRYIFLLIFFWYFSPVQSIACEATYNRETGTVMIPCVLEDGTSNFYSVEMEKSVGWTFDLTSVRTFELADISIKDIKAQIVEIPYLVTEDSSDVTLHALIAFTFTAIIGCNELYENIVANVIDADDDSALSGSIHLDVKLKSQSICFTTLPVVRLQKTVFVNQPLTRGTFDVVVNGISRTTLTVQ